jgi:hypothetical protein
VTNHRCVIGIGIAGTKTNAQASGCRSSDPQAIMVLAPDDPIATESALVLAAQAEASTRAAVGA